MTWTRPARIPLYLVAAANLAVVAVTWPAVPRTPVNIGTLVVCGGGVLLAYRDNPARFHRPVGRGEAVRALMVPVVIVGIAFALSILAR
jgi:uncharacterized membrane protein